MQQKEQNANFLNGLKSFIKYRHIKLLILISFLIWVGAYFLLWNKPDLKIFPSTNKLKFDFYTDSADNGNSQIEKHIVSDSLIDIRFTLKEGFIRPYIGINIHRGDSGFFNISAYNQVEVELYGKDIKNIVVYLITDNENRLISGNLGDFYFGNNIEANNQNKSYHLNLNDFKIPDWWFDVNNLSPTGNYRPDWKKLSQINLTTGLTPTTDISRELIIHSIRFARNNSKTIFISVFIEILFIIILFVIHLIRFNKPKKYHPITITYKSVHEGAKSNRGSDFLSYINDNFHNNTLSLDEVATACNISQRRVSNTIIEQFNCNFKTYVNLIRINEAKRLLKESDLHISEVAYKVGFNSPNHFNRVFKTVTGENPTYYLKNYK